MQSGRQINPNLKFRRVTCYKQYMDKRDAHRVCMVAGAGGGDWPPRNLHAIFFLGLVTAPQSQLVCWSLSPSIRSSDPGSPSALFYTKFCRERKKHI